MEHSGYKKMALMLFISLFVMYGVMFMNVDRADHIYFSLTRLYMSVLMVAPMAVMMLLLMGKMYPNRRLNRIIAVTSGCIFVLALFFLRAQVLITDKQYMRAMIPHHSSAILTSKHATIKDPEVKRLSESIIASQEREIEEMKTALQRMEK